MTAITPPPLKRGDLIALISTARKVDPTVAKAAQKQVEAWGFGIKLGQNLFEVENQFAGSDDQRAADLDAAIKDPEVRAIMCARGGYGTARILGSVDFENLRKNPKWIIGYSDVTALHCHAYTTVGVQGIHGSMPINFVNNTAQALEGIRLLLMGNFIDYTFAQHRLSRPGIAEGELIGGNLSVLYSLLGTVSFPNLEGKILVLEDLDEYLYHIDRMMLALERSGKLNKLAGMVVGSMTEMRDNPVPFGKTAEEIIIDRVANHVFPVAFGFPSGHITDNRAWIQGKKMRLVVKHDQPSLLNHN